MLISIKISRNSAFFFTLCTPHSKLMVHSLHFIVHFFFIILTLHFSGLRSHSLHFIVHDYHLDEILTVTYEMRLVNYVIWSIISRFL